MIPIDPELQAVLDQMPKWSHAPADHYFNELCDGTRPPICYWCGEIQEGHLDDDIKEFYKGSPIKAGRRRK